MKQTTYPHRLYQAPKSPQPARTLTTEEKAALWDEAQALHQQARAMQAEIDKLRFKMAGLQSKRDGLYELNRPDSAVHPLGPCTTCQYEVCQCER